MGWAVVSNVNISGPLVNVVGHPLESCLVEKASVLLREVAEYFFHVMRGRENNLSGDSGGANLKAHGCALGLS